MWEKILDSHISSKGFVSRICKYVLGHNNKMTNEPVKNELMFSIDISQNK